MRTKQEIIDFLESKVGTKVVCVGNTSLSGQCVTLIKSLMEFLGVPDPYKARGNAKDCIAKYLSEGIAKPGMGFISVFSNKDMAKGVGHIWCNAGEGMGTFYESNGAKPLTVTKGKTYTYDNVCNFDSYIKEDNTSDLQAQLDDTKKTLADVTRQRDELDSDSKKKDGVIADLNEKLTEATTASNGFRKQFNDFLSQLASKLDTRQETVEILAAIDTCITFEDKATELDIKLALEVKEHQADVESFGKEIAELKTQLASLETKYKELKDAQTTPIQTGSFWDIIKSILGRK